jgi:hypothetical protein
MIEVGFYGTYDGLLDVRSYISSFSSRGAKATVALAASILLVAHGFVLGARASDSPTIEAMVVCGVSIVGGYILGHVGMHKEVL